MEKLFQEAWDQGIKGISKYKQVFSTQFFHEVHAQVSSITTILAVHLENSPNCPGLSETPGSLLGMELMEVFTMSWQPGMHWWIHIIEIPFIGR